MKKKERALLTRAVLDEEGREINNPVPILVTSDSAEESLEDKIRRIIRVKASQEAHEQGMETWEEANDFDIEDEFEMEELDTAYTLQDEYPVMAEESTEVAESQMTDEDIRDESEADPEKIRETDAESQEPNGNT